ncbi:hypothetical protein D3C76_1054320 [compost metagenome]
MHAEKTVGPGDDHLVHVAQLRHWQNLQTQFAAGIAFGLRIEAEQLCLLTADQRGQALHRRHLDKPVDRNAAAELFANSQQEA